MIRILLMMLTAALFVACAIAIGDRSAAFVNAEPEFRRAIQIDVPASAPIIEEKVIIKEQ